MNFDQLRRAAVAS